jgi:hypothetical protein
MELPWWYLHGLEGPYAGRRVESVDPGGVMTAAIPPARAIGCVVYCSTEIAAPGVIRHLEGTRFSIGEPTGSLSARCESFSGAMVAGGLKSPVATDLRGSARKSEVTQRPSGSSSRRVYLTFWDGCPMMPGSPRARLLAKGER